MEIYEFCQNTLSKGKIFKHWTVERVRASPVHALDRSSKLSKSYKMNILEIIRS